MRNSKSLPGSAWDTWHLAGHDHVMERRETVRTLEDEARGYVLNKVRPIELDSNCGRTCQRAWLAGARQAQRHLKEVAVDTPPPLSRDQQIELMLKAKDRREERHDRRKKAGILCTTPKSDTSAESAADR